MYVGIASGHIKLLSPRLPSKSLFLLDENMSRFASRIVQFYSLCSRRSLPFFFFR